MSRGETTLSFIGDDRKGAKAPVPEHLALLIAWFTAEPGRAGEVAILSPGTTFTLGRGDGDGNEKRVTFVRQRPGLDEAGGPLGGLGLSRDQLRIVAHADSLEVERIGKGPVELRGVAIDRCTLRAGEVLLVRGQLVLLCVRRPAKLSARRTFEFEACGRFGEPDALGMIGESEVAWRVREEIAFAAQSGEHVLLFGESGTGKELAAQAIHRLSRRSTQPFVARNAATLPPGLIDAELFGHARNYPNAGMTDRAGLVGEANGGMLFLDEIAELPHEMQSHLLRVLDGRGEYQRLGDGTSRRSDFVLVGATNREASLLKHDLVARFALQVELPPLRSRQADIPLFVRHLLRRAAAKSPQLVDRFFVTVESGGVRSSHPRVDPKLVVDLLGRAFASNVRELEAATRGVGRAQSRPDARGARRAGWQHDPRRCGARPAEPLRALPLDEAREDRPVQSLRRVVCKGRSSLVLLARARRTVRALLEQVKKQKKTRPRVPPDAAFATLAQGAKGACSADLVALLTFLANHRLTRLGLWNVASAKEMTRPLGPSTPWSDPASIATATSTLFLGKDGSGWRIFAVRSPDASDVFLHDTGTGQLALLATSIPAFVELNLLVEGWERFCEDEDIDPDPEAMREIDPKHPRFVELRTRARALQGRVSLASRSDYDETVNALAKAKLRAKSASDVVKRYEAAKRAASSSKRDSTMPSSNASGRCSTRT